MKNIVRSAVLAAAVVAMAGCTGANQLLNALPTGAMPSTAPTTGATGTTPTNTTTTTTSSTAPSTPKPSASTDLSKITAADCTRSSSAATPDLLDGTSYGKFNGQHVPNGWSNAYSTEKEVWKAIDDNSSVKPEDWACFQKFYPGATQVYKDLASKYAQ